MKATSIKVAISLLVFGLASTGLDAESASSLSSTADEAARQVAEAFEPLQGTILSALADNRFLLDVTAQQGAYVGMEMEVFREGPPFKHPRTGEVLGRLDRPVGVVRVVEVKEKFSMAEAVFVVKDEEITEEDGVRVTKARILVGLANVTSSVIDERQARVLTREIEAALLKTGRFEVMDERMMRSTLVKAEVPDTAALTDPHNLGIVRAALRLHAVLFPVVRAADKKFTVELKVLSTFSARHIYLASAEVGEARAAGNPDIDSEALMASSARFGGPSPRASASRAAAASPAGEVTPAWIGPPTERQGPLAGFVEPQVYTMIIPHPLQLIAVGHVTGGPAEFVGVSRDHVFVYRLVKHDLKLILDYGKSDQSREILSLSVGDINGNGRDEIVVSEIESFRTGVAGITNRLTSYVLEFDGKRLVPVWENVPLFLRVLTVGDDSYLMAQRLGEEKPFVGPLLQYVWQPEVKRYVKKGLFPLPDGIDIYGFTLGDLNGNKVAEIIRLAEKGTVQVFDSRSGAYLGGSEGGPYGRYVHIRFEQFNRKDMEIMLSRAEAYGEASIRVIPGEVKAVGLGDRGRGVVVAENRGGLMTKYRAPETTFPDESRLVFLAWKAGGLTPICQTRQLDRYTADFEFADLNGDGEPEIILLTLEPRYQLLGGYSGDVWVDVLYPGACR